MFYDGQELYGDAYNDNDDTPDEVSSHYERCQCRYCRCSIETEYGVTCSNCLNGAHQG